MARLEIRVAPSAGFCAGVRRAIDIALTAGAEQGGAHTLGALIHNRRVVEWLAARGVSVAQDLGGVERAVVLPSHGCGPAVREEAERRGLMIYDATCQLVRYAQLQAKELADAGYTVVIVGDAQHTEVKGIVAWAGGAPIVVVSGPAEAAALGSLPRVGVVAQTTESPALVEATVAELRKNCAEVRYEPTSCHVVTETRQAEARALAAWADLMLVVGGHDSANTRQLAKVCREAGTPTEQVEGAAELRPEWFRGKLRIGVTAGGSTPEWIMEEVIRAVKEFDGTEGTINEEAAAQAGQLPELKTGDVIKGRIAKVDDEAVMVDIGYKTEGVIPKEELNRGQIAHAGQELQPGEEIVVTVVEVEGPNGHPVLSKAKADESAIWDRLEDSMNNGTVVETVAAQAVKGGIVVDLDGVRGFVPASQVALSRVDDLSTWVGKPMRLRVIEIDKDRNRAVLSQRKILETEQAASREQVWSRITEGAVLEGTVRRLTDFGAFVDIGGVDGLVHVSEMSWERVSHPSEAVKEGDHIKVKVLKVDREAGRISLSIRATLPDPWSEKVNKYSVGQVIPGKVVRLADFGAFVQIEEGLDGLVHVSQLADHRVNKPEEVVKVGQEVKVKIIGIKPAEKRISLSLREASEEGDRDQYRSYMQTQRNEGRVTIGDILNEKKREEEGRE